jgi:hypothetical protein
MQAHKFPQQYSIPSRITAEVVRCNNCENYSWGCSNNFGFSQASHSHAVKQAQLLMLSPQQAGGPSPGAGAPSAGPPVRPPAAYSDAGRGRLPPPGSHWGRPCCCTCGVQVQATPLRPSHDYGTPQLCFVDMAGQGSRSLFAQSQAGTHLHVPCMRSTSWSLVT